MRLVVATSQQCVFAAVGTQKAYALSYHWRLRDSAFQCNLVSVAGSSIPPDTASISSSPTEETAFFENSKGFAW